jgi:hypothetical protein
MDTDPTASSESVASEQARSCIKGLLSNFSPMNRYTQQLTHTTYYFGTGNEVGLDFGGLELHALFSSPCLYQVSILALI